MRLGTIGALVLAACWNTPAPKSLPREPSPRGVEPAVYMTPRTDDFDFDNNNNQLFVSVWHDHGETVLDLLCQAPCLPNIPKPFSNAPEVYRSDRIRQIAPHVWEAPMRATAKAPFTLRLDLSSTQPVLNFDHRSVALTRPSFQDAGYFDDPRDGQHEAMLFADATNGREFLIRPTPRGSADTFLYLAPNSGVVQTVQARNWHYQLAPPDHDELSYFAVLHGEIVLPDGDATVDVDVIRSPASDVGLWLTRAHQSKVRFWQTNDANTNRYTACTNETPPRCQTLFLAELETTLTCPVTGFHRLAIWIDSQGRWRTLTADDHDRLLDAACKPAYAIEHVDDTKVVVKDASGSAVEFTTR